MNPDPPPRGSMVLYDRMDPPLEPGEYRLIVDTTVSLSGADLEAAERHFRIDAPRWSLPPTEVVGVYPPRNGHGSFHEALPHLVLGRRTLPWERSAGSFTETSPTTPEGAPPWLALLLFEDGTGEVEVVRDTELSTVLPASILAALGADGSIHVDAIEADRSLLQGILPTVEELKLLCHVRQVNTEDRELSSEDSDGWFGVVVCNRIPQRGRKWRACLVSVEGRTDLLTTAVPAVASAISAPVGIEVGTGVIGLDVGAVPMAAGVASPLASSDLFAAEIAVRPDTRGIGFVARRVLTPRDRLVLLHAWTFECASEGTFEELCAKLDPGMIGEVRGDWPKVTETGHLPMELRDRAGTLQSAWYRGPLVPAPITREPPHPPAESAEDLRRVSVETGLEDLSLASAFEVGRLLAASDARLAQDLMRWRRGEFRTAILRIQDLALEARLPGLLLDVRFRIDDLAHHLLPRWIDEAVPIADLRGIALSRELVDPGRLADAFGLAADHELLDTLGELGASVLGGLETIDTIGSIDQLVAEIPNLTNQLGRAGRTGGTP